MAFSFSGGKIISYTNMWLVGTYIVPRETTLCQIKLFSRYYKFNIGGIHHTVKIWRVYMLGNPQAHRGYTSP